MSRLVYFDCVSGVSGDMLLGALVDAGAPLAEIEAVLRTLPLSGWSLRAEAVQRGGLRALRVHVDCGEGPPEPERRLAQIEQIVRERSLPAGVADRASAVFRRLAEAEAWAHGSEAETVAFHAVGAADAIVDVVGVLAALRLLDIEAVYASALPLAAMGETESGHGPAPLPAQATLELLRAAGAPLRAAAGADHWELVTPTGAALVAELARFERPALRLERIGMGAGARELPHRPNVLRVWLGEAIDVDAGAGVRPVTVLETTLDDMTAEQVAFARDRIVAGGALDVWITATQMKKGRAGLHLTVIGRPEDEGVLARLLLRETSTLGVRVRDERRYEAERESRRFESSLGSVAVKLKRLPGEPPQVAPEFESCRALAERHRLPIARVFALVQREAEERLDLG